MKNTVISAVSNFTPLHNSAKKQPFPLHFVGLSYKSNLVSHAIQTQPPEINFNI